MGRSRTRASAAVVACAAVAAAAAPSAVADTGADIALDAINRARADAGLAPLRGSGQLARSSGRFGRRLMRKGWFGHGSSFTHTGYRHVGEVLGMDSGRHARPLVAVRRWMRSPTHRSLLLSPTFRYAGPAHVAGRFGGRATTIWVVRLGGR